MKFLSSLKKIVVSPIGIITLVMIIIVAVNYKPGTFLTGWDNLHPEFDFSLNIKRSFFSVWQGYQGLGLLGGMGHASDLVRQIFLWGLSFVFPMDSLRYIFHFVMLYSGALGAYFLIRLLLHTSKTRNRVALAGSILYLFNLSTLQMFYVPFEPFSAHFGFLPWLFYSFLRFTKYRDKKNLLLLFFINVLATPQGYVATFFLVYMMALSVISLGILILNRQMFKYIVAAFVVIFAANAFWLIPNSYYALTKANVTVNAKINQMSTEENFLRNKKFGDLPSTILLKGFWFDNAQISVRNEKNSMLGPWEAYIHFPLIQVIGYVIFALVIAGAVIAVKKRLRLFILFLPLLIFSFIIIANDTPVLSSISALFYKIPLFSQIFRFPFTKFSILYSLCASLFFALACITISEAVRKRFLKHTIFTLLVLLPIIFCFPLLQGHLFYSVNKLQIPSEYFALMNFFKTQPKTERIANFPQYTFWGWSFYRWGYSGSGLLWYGIEQPIVDRAFDVWGQENENYYHEVSYALYSGNTHLFENVLKKYQIQWLLVDENAFNPNSEKSLYFDKLREMIKKMPNILPSQRFGKIAVYKVNLPTPPKNNVYLISNLPTVTSNHIWNNYDVSFSELGSYQLNSPTAHTPTLLPTRYYPFGSLFTGRAQKEIDFSVKESADFYEFFSQVPSGHDTATLTIPPVNLEDVLERNTKDITETTLKTPEVYVNKTLLIPQLYTAETSLSYPENLAFQHEVSSGDNISIKIPKIRGVFSYDSSTNKLSSQTPYPCITSQGGHTSYEQTSVLKLESFDQDLCYDIYLPSLNQRISYIFSVKTKTISGRPLLFWLENQNSRRADIESYLSKTDSFTSNIFIQPPMEFYGLGYTIHLQNRSIGREKTINEIEAVSAHPLPYSFLSSLQIEKNSTQETPTLSNTLTVSHANPSSYSIRIPSHTLQDNSTLVLSQSFDPGWKAYKVTVDDTSTYLFVKIKNFFVTHLPFLFGTEIKDHVKVNNWENGWNISTSQITQDTHTNIILLYQPQYLQYIGFLLLIVALVILVL